MKFKRILLLFLFIVLIIPGAYPCSSFVLKNGKTILLGKNFDWTFDKGHVIKNLRHIKKFAYFTHTGQPATWVSKYGSITFNQNGKEMPYGGMNEKGLVVEMLWLDETKFNITENKEYVNELEWIQYQLDNFETIEEVTAAINQLKVYPIKGKIHYILADKNGKSIIVEYLDGQPIVFEREANTCQAITNKTVAYSAKYIDNLNGIPKRNTSETFRYHQLEKQIKSLKTASDFSEKTAFQMLEHVAIKKGSFKTVWSIVYDIRNERITFFTHSNIKKKIINLQNLNFNNEVSYFDLNQDSETVLDEKLKPYAASENLKVMTAGLTHLGFDVALCQQLSEHQTQNSLLSESEFSKNYFHFNISVPMTEVGKLLLFAVMDSEQNFKERKAVTGGYVMGTTVIGNMNRHIYGLRNGNYALIVLLDANRNKQLDFDKEGNPLEKYATFNSKGLKSPDQITFENTSGYFNSQNATVQVEWK